MAGKPIDMKINVSSGGGGGGGGGAKSLPASTDPRVYMRTLELMNAERQKDSVQQLYLSVQLNQVAHAHSLDMARRGYLGVATPEGEPVTEAVKRAGYTGKCEVLTTMGPRTPEELMRKWMAEPRYQAQISGAAFAHCGVGYCDEIWTVILGSPLAAAMKDVRDIRSRVLELVNREREAAKLAGLELSDPLGTAAQEHAADMARREYFGTSSPDGVTVGQRAQKAGFAGRTVACLCRGPVSPDEAVETWLKSSRGNLVHPEVKFLGVATTAGRWVLVLGTR